MPVLKHPMPTERQSLSAITTFEDVPLGSDVRASGGGEDTSEADPASDSSSNTDGHSDTSTIIYGHESFETFQNRVSELLRTLFLPYETSDIIITRLKGGGFNRIIGISLPSTHRELILRIPRFESTEIQHQVDTLAWLRSTAKLPVPVVIAYDVTPDNPIGDPYVLMERLAGSSLYEVIHEINEDQRVSLAENVAELIYAIHKAPVPHGIGPLCFGSDSTPYAGVHSFHDEDDQPPCSLQDASVRTTSSFTEFLTTSFSAQRAYAQERWPKDTTRLDYCDKLISASKVLTADIAANSKTNVLFHRDFASRNLLIHRSSTDDSIWEISGVLDWDDCDIAPTLIAYVCPGWLWAASEEPEVSDTFDENDWDPDEPPYNEVGVRIKAVFVQKIEALLPGYMDTIRRSRKYQLRKLYELARSMANCREDEEAAELVITTAVDFQKQTTAAAGEGVE